MNERKQPFSDPLGSWLAGMVLAGLVFICDALHASHVLFEREFHYW